MKKINNTLYIISPDRYLSLDGENVVISDKSEKIGRIPLQNIDGIIAFESLGISPALMGKCVSENKFVVFENRYGGFLASVEGNLSGNVLLRRKQYRIADDQSVSLDIARNIIMSKLYNSRWVLERTKRDHKLRIDENLFSEKSRQIKELTLRTTKTVSMDELRGIEGEAANIYFSVFDEMILQQKDDFKFLNRNRRPPLDKVNALLSFSYAIVTNMCASALRTAGLDPYVGFMHVDRPGRMSLALDLVEEFRAILCDRFVLSLINKKIIGAKDFSEAENGAVSLNEEGKKAFIASWQAKKQEEITHPFIEEKVQWGMIPYVQALLLARYLRGDLDAYPPFLWK